MDKGMLPTNVDFIIVKAKVLRVVGAVDVFPDMVLRVGCIRLILLIPDPIDTAETGNVPHSVAHALHLTLPGIPIHPRRQQTYD